ncbi:MAG: carboxylesterase family protein [Blautia sp.]|nr:carboxylesterase family protein [Blautia sp.]
MKRLTYLIVTTLVLLTASQVFAKENGTEVTVTGGTVSGQVNDGVYTYLGVPYATAAERFTEPTEASWEGVLDATQYGSTALQQSFWGGSEGQDNDCLNLNIWTNGLEDGGKRPVMVWYHGGGMTSGSANEESTNGRNLASREDVVVVTVNHRLGVMAYLDLSPYGEKYKSSGNVGVLDMVASLQWIHDNIEHFGGNPENVTIFGQSGGGAKVLALMTTPYANGLFHKAINQSGATDTLGPVFATSDMAQRVTELTLEQLAIDQSNIEDIQNIDFSELNNAGSAALAQVAEEFEILSPFGDSYSFEWMPFVDGDIIPTNPVLEEGFAENGKDIPLLIGSNLNEWNFSMGAFFPEGEAQEEDQEETSVLDTLRQSYPDKAEDILAAFEAAYPDVDPSNAALVDSMLRAPLFKITAHKADQNGANVYSYVMTYGAPMAVHGAEIPLVFDNTTAENEEMATVMSEIWASFARTGVPEAQGLPEWEPYTREGGAVMILDRSSTLAHHHDEELLSLLKPDYVY